MWTLSNDGASIATSESKQELGDGVNNPVKWMLINIKDLVDQYQVQGVPTFAFFKNGELLMEKQSGSTTKEQLVTEI